MCAQERCLPRRRGTAWGVAGPSCAEACFHLGCSWALAPLSQEARRLPGQELSPQQARPAPSVSSQWVLSLARVPCSHSHSNLVTQCSSQPSSL